MGLTHRSVSSPLSLSEVFFLFVHSSLLCSCSRLCALIGHRGEIASAVFSYDGSLVASASMDFTCKLWDTSTGQIRTTLRGHDDEVLDVSFDSTGQRLVTASADGMWRRVAIVLVDHLLTGRWFVPIQR